MARQLPASKVAPSHVSCGPKKKKKKSWLQILACRSGSLRNSCPLATRWTPGFVARLRPGLHPFPRWRPLSAHLSNAPCGTWPRHPMGAGLQGPTPRPSLPRIFWCSLRPQKLRQARTPAPPLGGSPSSPCFPRAARFFVLPGCVLSARAQAAPCPLPLAWRG